MRGGEGGGEREREWVGEWRGGMGCGKAYLVLLAFSERLYHHVIHVSLFASLTKNFLDQGTSYCSHITVGDK